MVLENERFSKLEGSKYINANGSVVFGLLLKLIIFLGKFCFSNISQTAICTTILLLPSVAPFLFVFYYCVSKHWFVYPQKLNHLKNLVIRPS